MTNSGVDGLNKCRERIDQIDRDILDLLNHRTTIVEEIGRIKQALEMAVYEPKREDQVFANVTGHNAGPLSSEAVRRIFERIIDEMRTVQKLKIMQKDC
ncbi:MAG: chorismate mutase [Bryobacteraceae bacterium]